MAKGITRTLTDKEITQLAGILPLTSRLTCEKHWVDGAELIAQGHTEDHNGNPFIPGVRYEQNFPVVIALNHKRNMKKIFKQFGDQGVLLYVQEAQINKIINNEIDHSSKNQTA